MDLDWSTVERIAPAFTAAAGLGWWFSGRFREVEHRQQTALDVHEDRDQSRHEENLKRFEKVSVGLAKLGLKNGNGTT